MMKPTAFILFILLTVNASPQETVYATAGRQDPLSANGGTARATAMGSAFVGVSDDASAMLWNPAGLSTLDSPQISLHHANLLAGAFQEVLLLGLPVSGAGVFGLSGSFVSYGSFDGRDPSGVLLPSYSANQIGIGLGWGKKIFGDFSAGFSFHGTEQGFANHPYFLMGLDGGLLLKTKSGWGFGFSYEGLGLGDPSQAMASSWRLGASKLWKSKGPVGLLASLGGNIEPQGAFALQGGVEASYQSMLFVRAGYDLRFQDSGFSGVQGLTAGAGIVLNSIRLDYAFVPYGDLGSTHLVSLGYSFENAPANMAPTVQKQVLPQAVSPVIPAAPPLPAPAPVTVFQPIPQTMPQVEPKAVPEEKGAPQTERTITMEFEVPAADAVVHAKTLAKGGKLKEAVVAFRDILQKNPNDASAWRELGNVYYLANRKDYAVPCFEKSLKLKEDKTLSDWLERYKAR